MGEDKKGEIIFRIGCLYIYIKAANLLQLTAQR